MRMGNEVGGQLARCLNVMMDALDKAEMPDWRLVFTKGRHQIMVGPQ